MVGHTGKLPETIAAVETLDRCFGILEAACREAGVLLAMTADHGNAEQMIDPVTGEPHTAHTTNPVPFIVCAPGPAPRVGGNAGGRRAHAARAPGTGRAGGDDGAGPEAVAGRT